MNAAQYAQVGDMIRLQVQFLDQSGAIIDLNGGTGLKIKLLMPDKTSKDFTGTLLTDGTDGIIYYDTASGDLNQAGACYVQGEATVGGETFSTRNSGQPANELRVYDNVDNA